MEIETDAQLFLSIYFKKSRSLPVSPSLRDTWLFNCLNNRSSSCRTMSEISWMGGFWAQKLAACRVKLGTWRRIGWETEWSASEKKGRSWIKSLPKVQRRWKSRFRFGHLSNLKIGHWLKLGWILEDHDQFQPQSLIHSCYFNAGPMPGSKTFGLSRRDRTFM
jgi:hypothetical protein